MDFEQFGTSLPKMAAHQIGIRRKNCPGKTRLFASRCRRGDRRRSDEEPRI